MANETKPDEQEKAASDHCPACGSETIGGMMSSFFVALRSGEPIGDWNDWSSESELGPARIFYNCNHEWEA